MYISLTVKIRHFICILHVYCVILLCLRCVWQRQKKTKILLLYYCYTTKPLVAVIRCGGLNRLGWRIKPTNLKPNSYRKQDPRIILLRQQTNWRNRLMPCSAAICDVRCSVSKRIGSVVVAGSIYTVSRKTALMWDVIASTYISRFFVFLWIWEVKL